MKHGVFFVRARAIDGLRSGRHRSLLAKMPKPNAKKRRVNRVKGFASRGRGKKWILVLLVVLLLIPAMQVAVVRFIRVKGFASRGSQGTKRPNVLRLRVAFNERQWVLHRFLDGLEEAIVGA